VECELGAKDSEGGRSRSGRDGDEGQRVPVPMVAKAPTVIEPRRWLERSEEMEVALYLDLTQLSVT
jgi:hypothetical protein